MTCQCDTLLATTLRSIVDSVLARHRDGGLPPPVSGPMAYCRLTCCLGRLLGTQHPHKLGVTRDMVVALLRYRPSNVAELITSSSPAPSPWDIRMRQGEGAATQACNLQLKSDFLKGLLQFLDCSNLVTLKRKNDQERKGHWMRFGKSRDPELDINHQLGLLMNNLGTRPSTRCLG
jgi:hypothetical protein